ncbi:hypothetical protein [Actinomadura sp. 7K534]|uniref:hypothetical protein n=1 Tax=Actinomadura sp. 7K534 TaxID=2530366 RepID=UPI001049E008|nr:hypothetical protein [Actinomadura sp. 7K534]TDB93870.1 hypothetical protein E1266_18855 [Actinomadura sp. 7K534]
MQPRRWTAAAAGWLSAGVLATAAGAGVISVGTGAMGLETETFTRITCDSVRTAKGGTVWHCHGQSPAQIRAGEEAARRAALSALRAHREGMTGDVPAEAGRTRLTFVDHDGRRDPERVTATRLPLTGRWIAHSGNVLGTGILLTLLGTAALAYGGYRTRCPHAA